MNREWVNELNQDDENPYADKTLTKKDKFWRGYMQLNNSRLTIFFIDTTPFHLCRNTMVKSSEGEHEMLNSCWTWFRINVKNCCKMKMSH